MISVVESWLFRIVKLSHDFYLFENNIVNCEPFVHRDFLGYEALKEELIYVANND